MKRLVAPTVLVALLAAGSVAAETPSAPKKTNSKEAPPSSTDVGAMRSFIDNMAQRHKFDRVELEQLFSHARLRKDIIEAISRPAEAKPWSEYRPIFVTPTRIDGGVAFWNENKVTLQRASAEFGVPEPIITAIIGVETRYGKHTGKYPVLDSLSTLAFAYPPRSKFFGKELEQYLLMTREENIDPLAQLGSYAGAMGIPQFISSSFRSYAVDFDGDGRRDLWYSTDDAIGSVGNYFAKHGWRYGQAVAHPVRVKGNGYKALVAKGIKPSLSISQLRSAGVEIPPGVKSDQKAALIELDGVNGKEYWLGWHNFYVISRYNHSELYSMAVFQLGNAIKDAHTKSASHDVRKKK